MSAAGSASIGQSIYSSATTRVSRLAKTFGLEHVICKEHLGPGAALRLRNETAFLERLAGIDGVVQLADGERPRGILLLRDCAGVALAQVLRQLPRDPRWQLDFAISVARALADVHRCEVIHRDINPSNILVSGTGQAILIDFDNAIFAGRPETLEPAGLVGTLRYLAPEQTGRTGRVVDKRADLYAFGVTLYEMATGQLPFPATDKLQLIHDHLVREPTPPGLVDNTVSSGLSAIIMRLLAKAPEHRYQSAEGLLHDLVRLRRETLDGAGSAFPLGERDFVERLAAPPQLIGRVAELAVLHESLSASIHSHCRTVLIEGPAGVGKSALAQQLKPSARAAGGFFVQGKFEQFQQDSYASGALMQAMRACGRLLLAEPLDRLKAQRAAMLRRLGRSAGLVAELIPEFAVLLDVQPEAPKGDPREAEMRLQQTVVDLIATIASPQRPLVILLDDLQWAGEMSLRAIDRLMTEPELPGLLLIGSYRPSEPLAATPMHRMLAQWEQRSHKPARIALAGLDSTGLTELVAGLLRCPAEDAHRLAQALHGLTVGNPFDTVEMINALRREGVLKLGEQGWSWEEDAVHHFASRGTVVDLLATRVARLPESSRRLLESMSCIGSSVKLNLLGAATGLGEAEIRDSLAPLDQDGLLVVDAGAGHAGAHFRHDRIQQAVLQGLDEASLMAHRLDMARRLALLPEFHDEAAQQYFCCANTLSDARELEQAAALMRDAAIRQLVTAIHDVAARYLSAARVLLDKREDLGDAALRHSIDVPLHESLYGLGRLDEADTFFASLSASTGDPMALVEPTCIQIRSLIMRLRMRDAIDIGLALLARLGIDVPADFSSPDIEQRLDGLLAWVEQDREIDQASRPQMKDPRLVAIAKLLVRTATATATTRINIRAMAWLLLECHRLWAEHGPSPELLGSGGFTAGVLIGMRRNWRGAYEYARHAYLVCEALGYEPEKSEARSVFCRYACHWFEPVESELDHVRRANQELPIGYTVGHSNVLVLTATMEIAPTVDVPAAVADAGVVLCQRTGNVHAAILHRCFLHTIDVLRGRTPADAPFEDTEGVQARVGPMPYVELTLAVSALLLGDRQTLMRHSTLGLSLLQNIPGFYINAHGHLFTAMARAWQLQDEPAEGHTILLADLDASLQWLSDRAVDQPHNFMHMVRLVEAERAWALRDLWRAAQCFDAALEEAQKRQRPWHRALITERCGLFHLRCGLAQTGRRLLADAHDQYSIWGAAAKTAQMEREHEFLRAPAASAAAIKGCVLQGGTDNLSADAMDLLGVLRASQALSSEISIERLAIQVTEVLESLTGATRVLLLLRNDRTWWLAAPGEPPMLITDAAERGLLALSAFGYAQRTQELLLVDDATSDDRFAADPYFAGQPSCSLLLVPITTPSQSSAMLYLENRQGRAAFGAQRLDAVVLVAGQLAVSLANAQLYEDLEQRVEVRTRELRETQAQLVATARRAGRAEIANNVLHNVGNVLNSVNVSADCIRRTVFDSRLDGLERAVALLRTNEHDLQGFLNGDPRGQAILPYLDAVTAKLRDEQADVIDELDRLKRSVDHIAHVVTMQQTTSGPSSILEPVQPRDLLEEAVRLSGEELKRTASHVVCTSEPLPPTSLDRTRLLQILVNLITNASQAMESQPAAARRITLHASVHRGANGDRLRISVRDNGEGITAENLGRVFTHGFSTRKSGHGFGLHSSAVASMELGGKLTAISDGPGSGSEFILDLPYSLTP